MGGTDLRAGQGVYDRNLSDLPAGRIIDSISDDKATGVVEAELLPTVGVSVQTQRGTKLRTRRRVKNGKVRVEPGVITARD